MAWKQALTSEMIFTQLLLNGRRDRTVIGKAAVPREVQAEQGNYPELDRAAKRAIPGAELIELEGVGHLPHIEAFDRFIAPYRAFLDRQTAMRLGNRALKA